MSLEDLESTSSLEVDSTPSPSPASESPAPEPVAQESPPPPTSTPPELDEEQIAAFVKSHPDRAPSLLDRLKREEAYNAAHQRDVHAGVQSEAAKIEQRLAFERQLEQGDAWLKGQTPEVRDRIQWDDAYAREISEGRMGAADFRRMANDVATWSEQRSVAPVRGKIREEEAQDMLQGLRTNLAADPDGKAVAEKWPELLEAAKDDRGQASFAKFLVLIGKEIAKREIAAAKRELATASEATVESTLAERLEGAALPRKVGASVVGGSNHLQVVMDRIANPDYEPSATDWKDYDRAVEAGLYPRRNN